MLSFLTNNAKEEIIREDGDFETTVYIKGEEFEDELEALILEKKKGGGLAIEVINKDLYTFRPRA